MNDKIKYIVTIKGLKLGFQVLEMDERFRNEVEGGRVSFLSKNNLLIESYQEPQLRENTIYLRGSYRKCDNEICDRVFSNHKTMLEFISNLEIAIDDWAENWEGFQDKEKEKEIDLSVKVKVLEETVKGLVKLSHNHLTNGICFDNSYGATGRIQP